MINQNEQYAMALDLFKNGQYKQAFLKLIMISNQYSNDINFLRLLSDVQLALHDFNAQVKTLKQIAKLSENSEDMIKFMNALYVQKEFENSIDQAILILQKKISVEQRIFVFKTLMKIYIELGEFESLKETCAQLDLLSSKDAEVEYAKALIHTAENDLDSALAFLRRSVHLNNSYDQGWTALALYHFQKGDMILARANLEKALDINPQNTTALKYLSQWVADSSEEVNKISQKLNFYLQAHNFDDEISQCHAQILERQGHFEYAALEKVKLNYYFGT